MHRLEDLLIVRDSLHSHVIVTTTHREALILCSTAVYCNTLPRAMAVASSDEDIPALLAALVDRDTIQIRKTEETPPRISVIDVAILVTGYGADYASQAIRNVCDKYPDIREHIADFKFKGRGQKNTKVAGVNAIVEIIVSLPGKQAARIRRQAAELLVRYLLGRVSKNGMQHASASYM